MNRTCIAALWLPLTLALVSTAAAQHHPDPAPGISRTPEKVPSPSPYSGWEKRQIKALSTEQIGDLEAGRGMGLALAAELNGFPGPAHVIELAKELGLSDRQLQEARDLMERMKAETIPLGRQVIEEERRLDFLFVERKIDPESLEQATRRIGSAQSKLRAAHLGYHLVMVELLSADQIAQYARLRGYLEGGH